MKFEPINEENASFDGISISKGQAFENDVEIIAMNETTITLQTVPGSSGTPEWENYTLAANHAGCTHTDAPVHAYLTGETYKIQIKHMLKVYFSRMGRFIF